MGKGMQEREGMREGDRAGREEVGEIGREERI